MGRGTWVRFLLILAVAAAAGAGFGRPANVGESVASVGQAIAQELTPATAQRPCPSLQALLDNAAPHSMVVVPPCIYRETITVRKPLTIVGRPGAEIRGSDVWVGWEKRGAYWMKQGLPSFPSHGPCKSGSSGRCAWPQQVFLDGQPLFQVAANPSTGQFAVRGNTVLLADDPNGRAVEVTTRTRWVRGEADHVTIQGFTMKHAANDSQTGAIVNDERTGWTIQHNVLSDTHGAVVSIGGVNTALLNNDISRGGQLGVHGAGESGVNSYLLVRGNNIYHNNTEEFDPFWEAGGLKIAVGQVVTIDGNAVYENDGPGLWCDIECRDVIFANNRAYRNGQSGIFFEISDGARIYNNIVWENGWSFATWGWGAGILISSAANAEVFNNLVAWNARGISVISQDRSEFPHAGNVVRDNVIIMGNHDGAALGWFQDWRGVLYDSRSGNRAFGNVYWSPDAESGRGQFHWTRGLTSLPAFSATPGGGASRFLSSQEKDAILSQWSLPSTAVARDTNWWWRAREMLKP